MSLEVSPALKAKAEKNQATNKDLLDTVASSLTLGYPIVDRVIQAKLANPNSVSEFRPGPKDVTLEEMSEVSRIMASEPIRNALLSETGLKIAMLNCCTIRAFGPGEEKEYQEFSSPSAQLLNQVPGMKNC